MSWTRDIVPVSAPTRSSPTRRSGLPRILCPDWTQTSCGAFPADVTEEIGEVATCRTQGDERAVGLSSLSAGRTNSRIRRLQLAHGRVDQCLLVALQPEIPTDFVDAVGRFRTDEDPVDVGVRLEDSRVPHARIPRERHPRCILDHKVLGVRSRHVWCTASRNPTSRATPDGGGIATKFRRSARIRRGGRSSAPRPSPPGLLSLPRGGAHRQMSAAPHGPLDASRMTLALQRGTEDHVRAAVRAGEHLGQRCQRITSRIQSSAASGDRSPKFGQASAIVVPRSAPRSRAGRVARPTRLLPRVEGVGPVVARASHQCRPV